MLRAVRRLFSLLLAGLVGCASARSAPPPPPASLLVPTPTRALSTDPPRLTAPEPRLEPAPGPSASASSRPPHRAPSASRPEAPPGPAARRSFTEPVVPRAETRANVLLYHAFDRGAQPLSVSTRDFEAQLAWLAENHVEIIATSELLDFLDGSLALPARVAVISIDDGLISVYTKAWPILKRRGVRFTLGLPTGMLEDPKNAPVMSWDQVREMLASGLCELASHGHMHRRLVNLSGRRLREELELSRDLIRERAGTEPVAYFYPLGAFDAASAKQVERAGYRAAFRATGAPIAAGAGSRFWLPRVSIFHGESTGVLAHYFGARFLGQVRYSAAQDPASPRSSEN